jgi:flotillin
MLSKFILNSRRYRLEGSRFSCLVIGSKLSAIHHNLGRNEIVRKDSTAIAIGAATSVAVIGAWLSTRYHVAGPSEYLVRTGIFVDGVEITKQCLWLPYQTLNKINLEPITYHCLIEEAMSLERISFNMPTVFTIGPEDNSDALRVYAKLFQNTTPEDLKMKLFGIIQGEARVAAGKIHLDDIFNDREVFKSNLVKDVNSELHQFGLRVYNANIEELRDLKGNEYFSFMKKKALEGAVNKAKVDVAEQTKIGDVGEKRHKTETRQQNAEYEKQATLAENARDIEIANSKTSVDVAKAEFNRMKLIAEYESQALAEQKRLELATSVEITKNRQEIERLRAKEFSAASVQAEIKIKISEGSNLSANNFIML